jgi:hypothetical protein
MQETCGVVYFWIRILALSGFLFWKLVSKFVRVKIYKLTLEG